MDKTRDLKYDSCNNLVFDPYVKIGYKMYYRREKNWFQMYQHHKETITKAANEPLGIEEHNKYPEKFSHELGEIIKRKKNAFHK